jgi:protein-tyrosine sulfotransferase
MKKVKLKWVVIIGVPRSGTTLLRVFLDSHSKIIGLPETPWMLGSYGNGLSLRELIESLLTDRHGPVLNIKQVSRDSLFCAARSFLVSLFSDCSTGTANILVVKTPDDIRYINWLPKLFPDALYIHLTRDGRDVALSTIDKKAELYSLFEDGDITLKNALRRWCKWEALIRSVLSSNPDLNILRVKYEDLVLHTASVLKRICERIGVPYEHKMSQYWKEEHEYPGWEAGSQDVRCRRIIDEQRVNRWRTEFSEDEIDEIRLDFGDELKMNGYEK